MHYPENALFFLVAAWYFPKKAVLANAAKEQPFPVFVSREQQQAFVQQAAGGRTSVPD